MTLLKGVGVLIIDPYQVTEGCGNNCSMEIANIIKITMPVHLFFWRYLITDEMGSMQTRMGWVTTIILHRIYDNMKVICRINTRKKITPTVLNIFGFWPLDGSMSTPYIGYICSINFSLFYFFKIMQFLLDTIAWYEKRKQLWIGSWQLHFILFLHLFIFLFYTYLFFSEKYRVTE